MDADKQQLYKVQAANNAIKLVAYTAKIGKKIDSKTLGTLTIASEKLQSDGWTPDFEVQFWTAFRKVSELISPATIDSVKAICYEPKPPGFRGVLVDFLGRSSAQRTSKVYTLFTLLVMLVLLVFQVYWVIGNTLEVKLTELLNTEKDLTSALYQSMLDFSELELFYKSRVGIHQNTT